MPSVNRWAVLALVAVGGIVIAMAGGMATALTGRAVSGAGAALLMVVLSTLVTERFSGSAELVMALGAMLAAWPLGIAVALVVLPSLAEVTTWRVAMLVVALAAALAFALGRGDSQATAASSRALPRHWPRTNGAPWPSRGGARCRHHVRNRLGRAERRLRRAARLRSRSAGRTWHVGGDGRAAGEPRGMGALPVLPFGGALADRTGRPLLAASLLHGAAGAAVVVLVTDSTLPAAAAGTAIMAAGLLSTPPGPVIMALPARALSAETRAVGMGVYYTLFYAGMAAFPPLAGVARDLTGFAAAPLVVAAMFHGVAIIGIAAYALLQQRALEARLGT